VQSSLFPILNKKERLLHAAWTISINNYYGVQSEDMYTLKAYGTVGGVSFTAVPISNPDRRGAFGGNQVTVHDYTQWGSEDISISFN